MCCNKDPAQPKLKQNRTERLEDACETRKGRRLRVEGVKWARRDSSEYQLSENNLKGLKFLLRPRTFERNMPQQSEEVLPLSQAGLYPAKVFACLFPLHSPEHKSFVISLFAIQGSFPCSNNNITLGLEKQSPVYMKRNQIWSCCRYLGTHIQLFDHWGRGGLQ